MSDYKKYIDDAISAGREYFGIERWNYSGEYTGFRDNWINAYVVACNKKQEELEHKLELAKEALESISVKEYHCLCNHICKEVLEKLK